MEDFTTRTQGAGHLDEFRQLLEQGQAQQDQVDPPHRDVYPADVLPSTSLVPRDLPEQFDCYRIRRKLGAGGMGTVYLAEDTNLDRRVALKVPHRAGPEDAEMLVRMRREAQAAARLSHPNVCPVYHAGEVDGIPFFTMAYIEGRPLSEILAESNRAGQRLAQRWCAGVIAKVAQGIQAAHKEGIIHRDLNPAKPYQPKMDPKGLPWGTSMETERPTWHFPI